LILNFQYGWLPWIFEVKYNNEAIYNYLKWVYNTIVLKDIVKYYSIKNIDFMDSLYKFIFSNIWNIFSAKTILDYLKSQKLKISVDSILLYLQYAIKVFLINLVKSQASKTKKYFEIYNKYYVWDLWLRNAIVGCNLALDIWWLLENYVYNYL
jgi:predicted AAA+ superfamily ATPase